MEDRFDKGNLTGAQRGRPSTVTGTDIGYAFEQGNELRFLFGDTHEVSPDFCEPNLCGTIGAPTHAPVVPADSEKRIIRAQSLGAWAENQAVRGDGAESMARTAAKFNPDDCIRLKFDTAPRGAVTKYPLKSAEGGASLLGPDLVPGPPVAAYPSDRFVVPIPGALVIVTESGGVWSHPFNGTEVGPAVALSGLVSNASSARAVVSHGTDVFVVEGDGAVAAYGISGSSLGPRRAVGNMSLTDVRWIAGLTHGIVAISSTGSAIGYAYDGASPAGLEPGKVLALADEKNSLIGARPDDRFVVGFGEEVAVTNSAGEVHLHHVLLGQDGSVGVAHSVSGPTVALGADLEPETPSAVRHVFAYEESLFSVAPQTEAFRRTTLDGQPLGRKEGVVSGFAEGDDAFGFFTKRKHDPGCTLPWGCAHDEVCEDAMGCEMSSPVAGCRNPDGSCQSPGDSLHCGVIASGAAMAGGTVILGISHGSDSSAFEGLSAMSSSKFLWPMPELVDGAAVEGLPAEVRGGKALLVWGTGRKDNTGRVVSPWNESAPYLAVTSMDQVRTKSGLVFGHRLAGDRVGKPIQVAGPIVAALPEDKHVFTMADRLFVVTSYGGVFTHSLAPDASSLGPAVRLVQAPCGLVGAQAVDKWVVGTNERIFVVTQTGSVFAHEITGNTVQNAVQYAVSSPVGAQTQDKYLFAMGGRLIVVLSDGHVFAHDIDFQSRSIGAPYALAQYDFVNSAVGARPGDKRVLAVGNRLYVIRQDGSVWFHEVTASTVEPARGMASMEGSAVGTRAEDKFIVGAKSPQCPPFLPNCDDRLLVITRPRWWYFGGESAPGVPDWKTEESLAAPMAPFGSWGMDTLGYFSVRRIADLDKWVMLFGSPGPVAVDPNDPPEQENHLPRGIYLTTSSFPWGQWSPPQRVLDAADSYCHFTHQVNLACPSQTQNAAEEGRRGAPYDSLPECNLRSNPAADPLRCRAWGAEYAPYLLPSRYSKRSGGSVPIYFELSTWNPYQVVLMKTAVNDGL